MKIENGRWIDQHGDPINNFNVSELLEIADNVTNVYGEDITYSRINLISTIKTLTPKQEDDLAYVLSSKDGISKLAGY